MTRARSVAASALFDQAAAAGAEAVQLMAAVAASTGGRLGVRVSSGPCRALAIRLGERVVAGELGTCQHLTGGPQPAVWVACRPAKLRCAPCATALNGRLRGTREDQRCDRCRRDTGRRIYAGAFVLPPVVVDLPDLLAASGPVIVTFGLCPRCHHAADLAGQAER